ncbi:right-handed parallel beta-helix repeat-containing protein [Puniceicoccaceae bacterium K14]|nr:right-handed parallel beta-helix repeat-containing protein [Puniceicoccaceae bacterium K14]
MKSISLNRGVGKSSRYFYTLLLYIIKGYVFSSNCIADYDHVIPVSMEVFDGDDIVVRPGDVVGIEAGDRGELIVQNISGAAMDPVIFVNKGGQVRIGNLGSGDGIKILGSEHFELRGDGDPSVFYGIDVYKAGGQCIKIAGLSSNFEICFIEVSNPGFAGIMAKTDPGENGYAHRGTFTQYDTVIHDIYAHDVPGESLYIGNSFYASGLSNDLVGVRIYNVISERSGREGIQVGSASSDCEIYDNVIRDAGLLRISGQSNGLQIGEGTTGKCYGNIIINAPANGIVCLGLGNNLIYNNVIANTGTNGIFSDNRAGAEIVGGYVRVYNNTIINPTRDGLLSFNEVSENEFKNNIVIGSDADYHAVNTGNGATVSSANNVYQLTTEGLKFVDTSIDDYRILSGSVAIDAGIGLSPDVTEDIEGLARPLGHGYDVGAYESGALSVTTFCTNPSKWGVTDGSISVSVIGGRPPYTYAWSQEASEATLCKLSAGSYSVTVTDSASVSVTRKVTLTQSPKL